MPPKGSKVKYKARKAASNGTKNVPNFAPKEERALVKGYLRHGWRPSAILQDKSIASKFHQCRDGEALRKKLSKLLAKSKSFCTFSSKLTDCSQKSLETHSHPLRGLRTEQK